MSLLLGKGGKGLVLGERWAESGSSHASIEEGACRMKTKEPSPCAPVAQALVHSEPSMASGSSRPERASTAEAIGTGEPSRNR